MALKERISSPLEAGTSILDAHHLSPQLVSALEYVSSRVAKKALHVTLVAVRRDYQLPSVVPPAGSPGLPTPTTPGSPRLGLTSSPVAALKQLVRSGSNRVPRRFKLETSQTDTVPPLTPLPGLESPRMRWPGSPLTPLSPPPMTPCTASSTTTDTTGPVSSSSYGLRLIHPSDLPAKDDRLLFHTLQKAQRKFNIGPEWLSPAVSPATCGLTNQLIHQSIVQNEVLFSSEGLTLLSLDRLYSLKAALSAYSRTRSPLRLEDAVDELRRLVLANNGCKVTKADLLRSYDWLSVSKTAISDLDRMYKKAYGGYEEVGAISGMPKGRSYAVHEPVIRRDDETDDGDEDQEFSVNITLAQAPKKSHSPKAPVLKLQTNFDTAPKQPEKSREEEDQEDPDRTPRPSDWLPIMLHPCPTSSIDEVLSADVLSPDRNSVRLGPATPNGYDDISPTTRGEWGFLMVDNAFQGGRTVAVETC